MKTRTIKFTLLIFVIFLTACDEDFYIYDMYLTRIEVVNLMENSKSEIYFECDNYGDSIVVLEFLKSCEITTNKLWKHRNFSSVSTTDKIFNEIIYKNHFKIYRYRNEKKEYLSFKKLRATYPLDACTFKDEIDNTDYVYYTIFTCDKYFE
jgi:hypothetical protein